MVQVHIFGLLRLDTGLKDISAEAGSVRELYPLILEEAKKLNPGTKVTAADLNGCIVMINGEPARKRSRLRDGDDVMLMSPVCGG